MNELSPYTVSASETNHEGFDEKVYRNTLGLFSTGVTIVTTIDENSHPIGITVNSFASVSLKPALVLWSIDKSQPSYNSFLSSKEVDSLKS